MRELLLDVALSFCPASVRSAWRPYSSSRVLLAAILTGITQTVLCARVLFAGYVAFLALRSQQYEHVLKSANVTTQAWLVVVFFVEYVIFHPFPLILLYLAFEGGGSLCGRRVRVRGGPQPSCGAGVPNSQLHSGEKSATGFATSDFSSPIPWKCSPAASASESLHLLPRQSGIRV